MTVANRGAGVNAPRVRWLAAGSLAAWLELVVQADDAAGVGGDRGEGEGEVEVVREDALAPTDAERVKEQVEVVDELVLQEQGEELGAAVGHDVLAGGGLELPGL